MAQPNRCNAELVFVPRDPQAPTTRDTRYAIRGLGNNSAAAKNHDGDDVCIAAAVSGTDCAEVLGLNFEATYESNGFVPRTTVKRLARTNLCSARGDSGGPIFKQHRAFGILSGLSAHDSKHRCYSFYTGALTAERELGMRIG